MTDRAPDLPPLREDIQVNDAKDAPQVSTPSVALQLYDPVTHRYFDIGASSAALLKLWHLRDPSAVVQQAALAGVKDPKSRLEALLGFLRTNGLVQLDAANGLAQLERARKASRTWRATVGRLTFHKVILGNPDRMLDALYTILTPLLSRGFRWLTVLAAALAGLMLVRRPELVSGQFQELASLRGAVWMILALAIVKLFHELGHGLQAKRLGVNVNAGGVMFMMGLPLPFVELSDGWRLGNRGDRLRVDAGGVLAELAIACWAGLLFVFWPDGAIHTLLFMLMGSSMIMSIVVNLNPLMRFDGYFLLSDALGIRNLQPRSAAIALWALRTKIIGLHDPVPEILTAKRRFWMGTYGAAVWVYRLFLYAGIAFIAYQMFSKVIGLAVLILQVTSFVIIPMVREIAHWIRNGKIILTNRRGWTSLTLFAGLIALLAWPFERTITLPARLEPPNAQALEARPATWMIMGPTAAIEASNGMTLWQFDAPEIAVELARIQTQIALLSQQIERAGAQASSTAQLPVLRQEQARLMRVGSAFEQRRAQLNVTAPFDGHILPDVTAFVPPGHPPLPIARASLIGYAIPTHGAIDCQVSAYFPADSLRHVMAEAPARFRANGHSHLRVDASLTTIAASPATTLSAPEIAARFGGPVAVTGAQMALDGNWHRIIFSTPSDACAQPSAHVIVGTVHMKAARASLLERAINRIAQVLVRELSY